MREIRSPLDGIPSPFGRVAAGVSIPNGAIVQRDGAYVLDRAGNYVINVAQS